MIIESLLAGGLIFGSNSLDVSSTLRARQNGAIEVNPFMRNSNVFLGSKLAFSAGEQFGFEKLRKKNRVLAWVWVGTITSVNLAIYKHNERVRRSLAAY